MSKIAWSRLLNTTAIIFILTVVVHELHFRFRVEDHVTRGDKVMEEYSHFQAKVNTRLELILRNQCWEMKIWSEKFHITPPYYCDDPALVPRGLHRMGSAAMIKAMDAPILGQNPSLEAP